MSRPRQPRPDMRRDRTVRGGSALLPSQAPKREDGGVPSPAGQRPGLQHRRLVLHYCHDERVDRQGRGAGLGRAPQLEVFQLRHVRHDWHSQVLRLQTNQPTNQPSLMRHKLPPSLSTRFTKQSRDNNAGFEGGSIRRDATPSDAATEEVNMTTGDPPLTRPDAFTNPTDPNPDLRLPSRPLPEGEKHPASRCAEDRCGGTGQPGDLRRQRRHPQQRRAADLRSWPWRAVPGANGILSLSLSLSLLWYPPPSLTLTLTYAQVAEMDALGYSCYSTSRAGLFKYNGSPLLPAPPSPP